MLVHDELGKRILVGLLTGQIRHMDNLNSHLAAPSGRTVELVYTSVCRLENLALR
jgi:hypothetical protein